jgi:YbbR domain-containing protein
VQIIRKNFTLKLLALFLAILGWAYFRFAANPIVAAARFAQQISVPIVVVNLPSGYVSHFTEREAVVTVEARRGDPAIKPDEIKAVLDLSNKTPGVYNVPIELVAPQVAVQSLSPATIALTIERIENRIVALTVHYAGEPGGTTVVSGVHVAPATVTVEGPVSLLAQVATVRVDVTLPSQPKLVDEMVRPIVIGTQGSEVGGLQIAPNLVRVQMHVVAGSQSK